MSILLCWQNNVARAQRSSIGIAYISDRKDSIFVWGIIKLGPVAWTLFRKCLTRKLTSAAITAKFWDCFQRLFLAGWLLFFVPTLGLFNLGSYCAIHNGRTFDREMDNILSDFILLKSKGYESILHVGMSLTLRQAWSGVRMSLTAMCVARRVMWPRWCWRRLLFLDQQSSPERVSFFLRKNTYIYLPFRFNIFRR